MEWIYKSHILCTQHIQMCELEPRDAETCACYTQFQRTYENIRRNTDRLDLGVAIDEWFHKSGSSDILSFGYIKGDEKQEDSKIETSEYGLSIKEKVSLAPREICTVWSRTEEIKRTNDVSTLVGRLPKCYY